MNLISSLGLDQASRLLLSANLQPVQGERFQPTGFADLGAATYTAPVRKNGELTMVDKLLVESVQSVANRLETVCWDDTAEELAAALHGMPYIRVEKDGKHLTNSILEAHRINSPYILDGSGGAMLEGLKAELTEGDESAVDLRRAARVVFRYDPNSVLHGAFLARKELAGGRIRLQRLLSGFIEASGVRPVDSGGVKNDRVNPKGDAENGYGNVPFARTEYVAEEITAFFNLDLATLRSYKLGSKAEDFLVALALWKVRRFLQTGLRLRTACDLAAGPLEGSQKAIPETGELEATLRGLITGLFPEARVTVIQGEPEKGRRKKGSE